MSTIKIKDWELHYEQAGSGAPLLLIHGLGSGSADWQAQIEHFSRHYSVIAPDLRGHGRSGRPAPPYQMSDFADDLIALMDALSLPDAHVVGISLGGGIAFQLAVQAPKRLRSLTIVNSGPELIPRTLLERFAIWQRLVIVNLMSLE
ncbi:MAG: alpha/beta fold hydrolase, partial [Pseudomonadota bacterium]|nr:alpha/beta fold hydrolase [Pseudomonadota bacterium]